MENVKWIYWSFSIVKNIILKAIFHKRSAVTSIVLEIVPMEFLMETDSISDTHFKTLR